MKITRFNDNWKYWTDENAFALVWNIPKCAKDVTLPHDAMLDNPAYADSPNGGNTGFRDGGVYHYVKLFCPSMADREKTLLLKFEGVYMNAFVYINGQLAAKCPYGYTGFYVALNDYLKFGEENEIRVIVRNSAMTNSRWYSGGGIYRDVYLLTGEKIYIQPEGVRVKTEGIDDTSAILRVQALLKNRGAGWREITLVTEIRDAENHVAAVETCPITLLEGEERKVSARLVVEHPKLWSADTPDLYRVVTRLVDVEQEELVFDEQVDSFGIRTLTVDAKHGFRVNGSPVKLRGACIHHDSGILGAATFADAEYRRMRILKEAGFNAIRMSHQPAAPALLRACDDLGMYVMDEAFDMWQRCKSDSDYGLYFDEWWERDVAAMAAKDYNHPSVVMYSVGNEIPEIGTPHGARLCQQISDKIKEIDDTRPTLAAINGVFAAGDVISGIMRELITKERISVGPSNEIDIEGNVNDFMTMMDAHIDEIVVHEEITKRLNRACAGTDLAGYNYMTARYEKDGREKPNRVIVGSETYPPEIARNWALVEKLSHVIGDFTWTGWDYIGEAGVGVPSYHPREGGFNAKFPCQLAYCGDIDLTGFRRPASYFREIVFGLRRKPYLTVQNPEKYGQPLKKTPWVISDAISSWTFSGYEGKPVVVEIYAPGDQVELFLNGRSAGRKAAGKAVGFITRFELAYEPGTLEAVAFETGVEIGRMELRTAKGPGALQVTVEEGKENELIFISIANTDQRGIIITDREILVKASMEGVLEARMGSGDPKPVHNYTELVTETWNGRAQLILRRKADGQKVSVAIEAEGMMKKLTV